MGPWVVGGVETLLGRRVGVNLANEGEGTVEVGVPRDGANREEGRGGKGSARVDKRLRGDEARCWRPSEGEITSHVPRTRRRKRRRWDRKRSAVVSSSSSMPSFCRCSMPVAQVKSKSEDGGYRQDVLFSVMNFA